MVTGGGITQGKVVVGLICFLPSGEEFKYGNHSP